MGNRVEVVKGFADKLDDLIAKAKEEGLNHKKLAAAIGISDGSLSNFSGSTSKEKITTPTADKLRKICKYFDVSADWLLGLSEVKHLHNEFDFKAVVEYTGLSEETLEALHLLKKDYDANFPQIKLEKEFLTENDTVSLLNEVLCSESDSYNLFSSVYRYIHSGKGDNLFTNDLDFERWQFSKDFLRMIEEFALENDVRESRAMYPDMPEKEARKRLKAR